LAGPVGWGLYGIAAAGAIMLTAKNVCFTPAYAGHILGKRWTIFWRELGLIALVTAGTFFLCRTVLWLRPVNGWIEMCAFGSLVSAVYALAAYLVFLNRDERQMVRGMIPGCKK
jgi:membrane protein EpsK